MKRIMVLLVLLMATSLYAKGNDFDVYGECKNAYYAGFMAGVMWSNDKFNDNGEFYAWIREQISFDMDKLHEYMRGQADLVLIGKGLNNRASNKGLIKLFEW